MATHVVTELSRSRGRKDGRNDFRMQGGKPNLKTTPASPIQNDSEFQRWLKAFTEKGAIRRDRGRGHMDSEVFSAR
jgi:hypothetical protein